MSRKKSTRQRKTEPTHYRIFVSHATRDKWIAKVICEKLEQVGATTFRDDRDIQGGDDIPDEIRRQIKQSQEVLVLLTPQSIDREWVKLEIGAAWGHSKKMRIIGVRYHVEIDLIPSILKSKKSIDLNEFDQYLSDVETRVSETIQ